MGMVLSEQEKRNTIDMLNGDIARICVSDDITEITNHAGFAICRISMLVSNRIEQLKAKESN